MYFIARDGYILQKIADTIISQNNLDILTKYIYGSRKVWRIPSIDSTSDISFIFREKARWNTIDDVALAFDLELKELKKFLPKSLFTSKRLSETNKNEIASILSNNIPFKSFISNLNSERNNLAIEYLKQEIDLIDDNFAFVDLSGSGATLGCLAKLISSFYNKKIKSFYIRGNAWSVLDDTHERYVFLPNSQFISGVIEACCSAPHGSCVSYQRNSTDFIEPILDGSETPLFREYNYNSYIDGIVKFSKRWAMEKWSKVPVPDFFMHYQDYVLKAKISKQTADLIGSIPFKISSISSATTFAPRMKHKDVFAKNFVTASFNCSYLRSSNSVKKLYDNKIALQKKIKKYFSSKNTFSRLMSVVLGKV